ncbi:hypothetical protein HanPI659440_Chr13g0503471 [Helianthus annuus]|nr:hypothetical protein HanPI659440_Chr13g0503471 [Helianthus annuus]
MSKKEFHKMFEEWLDDTKRLMDDPYSMDKKETEYNQVVELLLEDKNKWIELMSFMMEDASGEKFHTEDGTPNESAIYG